MGCTLKYQRTLIVVLAHSWNIRKFVSGNSNTFLSLHNVYIQTKGRSRQAKLRMWARSGPSVGWCVAASVAANTQFQLDLSAPSLEACCQCKLTGIPGIQASECIPLCSANCSQQDRYRRRRCLTNCISNCTQAKNPSQRRQYGISDRVKWDHVYAWTQPHGFCLNSHRKYSAEFARP